MRDPHIMRGQILRDSYDGSIVRMPRLSGPNGLRELHELMRIEQALEYLDVGENDE